MAKTVLFAGGKTGIDNTRSINLMISDYKKFVGVVKRNVRRIWIGVGQIILEETLPLVPFETGALRASGRAGIKETPGGITAIVSFGGDDAPVFVGKNTPEGIVDYAVLVHERVDVAHPIGQAKYLEAGAIVARPRVDTFVISELRKIGK